MKKLIFAKSDAFASQNSLGNPAALVKLTHSEELTIGEKMQIAKELRDTVREVAFWNWTAKNVLWLQFFSWEREVPFCGHATIALGNLLFSEANANYIDGQCRRGSIRLYRHPELDAISIDTPQPKIFSEYMSKPHLISDLCRSLGCACSDIDLEKNPITGIDGGNRTLCVRFKNPNVIINLEPDYQLLRQFSIDRSIEVIHCAAPEKQSFRVRVFTPYFGYLEDPATGSANASFAHLLLNTGEWNGSILQIFQGTDIDSPNIILIEANINHMCHQVRIGGGAKLRINGEYLLQG